MGTYTPLERTFDTLCHDAIARNMQDIAVMYFKSLTRMRDARLGRETWKSLEEEAKKFLEDVRRSRGEPA